MCDKTAPKPLNLSYRYTLPEFYRQEVVETTCSLFLFGDITFEVIKALVDTYIEERKTPNTVSVYVERGIENSLIDQLQMYLQEQIGLDSEAIEITSDLERIQIGYAMAYTKRTATYNTALQN